MRIKSVPIDSVSPDPANARTHGPSNLDAIVASLRRFGQQKPIVVDRDGIVRAGNGMREAAKQLGWKTIAIVQTDLSGSDATAYAIADNRTAELAEWDDAILAAQLEALATEGDDLFASTGFDSAELDALIASLDDSGDDDGLADNYTRKIETPVYEITGAEPPVSELLDRRKADRLRADIDAADLPADVAAFLRDAAERHVVFDFSRVAEYYAHASAEIQELMERSALVIIDFDAAIEDGFVRLTEGMLDQAERSKAEHDAE